MRVQAAGLLLVAFVLPATAAAHHGADEGDWSGLVLWIVAGVGLVVLLAIRWLAVAHRRRTEARGTEPEE
jgi:NhaP-type Na+/H+ or K+/H+ antiporter